MVDHERDPLRQIANYAREPRETWQNRLNLLIRQVFANLPLVFLLDNFEDNLDDKRAVRGDLADLLARWIEQPGRSRLLFTCRHPFALPDDAAERLDALHLGPLSPAETRKLMLRLEGLGRLAPDEPNRLDSTLLPGSGFSSQTCTPPSTSVLRYRT